MNDNNNFSHIKFLKVPGGYDEYSAMRYLFQMGDFLNLPPKDLLNTISTIQKYLKKNHIPNKSNLNIRRYRDWETDRKSTRLNSSHSAKSRMPSSA